MAIGSAMSRIKSNDLLYLFSYTPHLQALSISIQLTNEYQNLPIIKTSITTLNVILEDETDLLNNLLENMPSSLSLTIEMRRSD